MRWLILSCVMAAAGIHDVSGMQRQRVDSLIDRDTTDSQQAAARALAIFRSIVDSQNYRRLGFDSVTDVHTATLGKPLVAFHIGLHDLRGYQPGTDPSRLLRGGRRIVYPVLVRGGARASVTLTEDSAGWKGVSYGGPVSAGLVEKALSDAAHSVHQRSGPYFLIRVLALNVNFLGYYDNNRRLDLIPLLDDPRHRWRAGLPSEADSVFAQLSGDAGGVSDTAPR